MGDLDDHTSDVDDNASSKTEVIIIFKLLFHYTVPYCIDTESSLNEETQH